jgi:hypothetical protein
MPVLTFLGGLALGLLVGTAIGVLFMAALVAGRHGGPEAPR